MYNRRCLQIYGVCKYTASVYTSGHMRSCIFQSLKSEGMKFCHQNKGAFFVAAVLLLAIPLVENAKSVYAPHGNVDPAPAGNTLLVEIYSTQALCNPAFVDFGYILYDLFSVSLLYPFYND